MWRYRWLLLWVLLLVLSHASRRLFSPEPPPLPPGARALQVAAVDGEEQTEAVVQLAYREWTGREGAPVVLFVHGSPGDAGNFAAVASSMSDDYRRISVDLPGFGFSSHSVPDYSSRAHAIYLISLLDALHIERVHLVAHSLGGAVVLEMAKRDTARIASLTMIAAVGVQELELLGDYAPNHALHGLQLGVVRTVDVLVPHFGLLDRAPILPYARNFYDTDQRPLRAILATLQMPLRILHGRHDLQVPVAAALEHHRIAPHSELTIWDDQSHFTIFVDPRRVADDVSDFISRVNRGAARTRSNITAKERAQAAIPYDPSLQSPVQGIDAAILGSLLALSTFASEDLTTVTAGLLVSSGRLSFIVAAFSVFLGIFVSDLGCVVLGRAIVRRVPWLASIWPLRRLLDPSALVYARNFVANNGPSVVFASRFMPGTRVAVYVAAGILEVPFLPFASWLALASAVWTVLVVAIVAVVGRAAGDWLARGGWLAGLLAVVLILAGLRLIVMLSTWSGRRRLLGAWRRWTQWEFWPPWLFYPPVLLYGLLLAIRYRAPTLFTAANPGIVDGGVVGESKWQIYLGLGLHEPGRAGHAFLPPTARLAAADTLEVQQEIVARFRAEHHLDWPIVLKPDVGQRGDGVAVIRSDSELYDYLSRSKGDLVVQAYVSGHELGVFYVRHPEDAKGTLFSITRKLPLDVTGDGVSTLERLILADARAVCMADKHLQRHAARLHEIPTKGERVRIQELGTHSRGSIFLDGHEFATDALRETFDDIASDFMGGFSFGRFDIRTQSLEELAAGRGFFILELNGVTSEATHIYGGRLLPAWRTLMAQWSLAFAIGAAHRARGAPVTSLTALFSAWRRYRDETKPGHASQ